MVLMIITETSGPAFPLQEMLVYHHCIAFSNAINSVMVLLLSYFMTPLKYCGSESDTEIWQSALIQA